MTNILQNFLVSFGFQVNNAGAAQVQAAVQQNQTQITNITLQGLRARQQAERAALAQQLEAAIQNNTQLTRQQRAFAERIIREQDNYDRQQQRAAQKQIQEKQKREDEASRKDKERRENSFRDLTRFAIRFSAINVALSAVTSLSLSGIAQSVNNVAKSYEGLGYAAARIGASPRQISAFAYAAGQTGSSESGGQQTLEGLGERLRKYKGYASALNRLGIQTEGRDTADIATDLGDRLRGISQSGPNGYARSIATANMYGIDEINARALMDPRFRQAQEQRKQDQRAIGFDPTTAVPGATAFERALRRLQAVLGDLAEKTLTDFAAHLTPLLETMTRWLIKHAPEINDAFARFGDNIIDFSLKFAKYLGSDQFKKDLQDFGRGISNLAKIILSTLRLLGVIPGANAAETGVGGTPLEENAKLGDAGMRGNFARSMRPGNLERSQETLKDFRSGRRIGRAEQTHNADIIADELRGAGMPDEGIAATLGSMQSESGFNGTAHNNIAGGHKGLIQWDSARWPKIKRWIESQGGDPDDVRWQTKAFIAEGRAKRLDPLYDSERTRSGFGRLMSHGGIDNANQGMVDIERFGPGEEAGRAANARAWIKALPKPLTGDVNKGGRDHTLQGLPDPKPLTTPGAQSSMWNYNNTRIRGDINLASNPTFNITTAGDPHAALTASRMLASRGQQDLLRNMQSMEA